MKNSNNNSDKYFMELSSEEIAFILEEPDDIKLDQVTLSPEEQLIFKEVIDNATTDDMNKMLKDLALNSNLNPNGTYYSYINREQMLKRKHDEILKKKSNQKESSVEEKTMERIREKLRQMKTEPKVDKSNETNDGNKKKQQ
jgi:hypothetical protein